MSNERSDEESCVKTCIPILGLDPGSNDLAFEGDNQFQQKNFLWEREGRQTKIRYQEKEILITERSRFRDGMIATGIIFGIVVLAALIASNSLIIPILLLVMFWIYLPYHFRDYAPLRMVIAKEPDTAGYPGYRVVRADAIKRLLLRENKNRDTSEDHHVVQLYLYDADSNEYELIHQSYYALRKKTIAHALAIRSWLQGESLRGQTRSGKLHRFLLLC